MTPEEKRAFKLTELVVGHLAKNRATLTEVFRQDKTFKLGQEEFDRLKVVFDACVSRISGHLEDFPEHQDQVSEGVRQANAIIADIETMAAPPDTEKTDESRRQFANGELMDLEKFIDGIRGIE